jgi:PEGA domain
MKKSSLTKILLTSMLACSLFGILSCAAIIHGKNQDIFISSQPVGAKILVDERDYGITPKTLGLPRVGRIDGEPSAKKEYKIKIVLDGFEPYEVVLQRKVDGWFFGNLLIGGVIGIVVDAVTGSMYKLNPNHVVAQMGKNGASNFKKKANEIYIGTTLKPNAEWQKIGQASKLP